MVVFKLSADDKLTLSDELILRELTSENKFSKNFDAVLLMCAILFPKLSFSSHFCVD